VPKHRRPEETLFQILERNRTPERESLAFWAGVFGVVVLLSFLVALYILAG
jgi:hypothetical protein